MFRWPGAARQGPDAKMNLVLPEVGRRLAQSALDEGAATESAVNVLKEEAKNAPAIPNAENRNSVRQSEGDRNFIRTLLRSAATGAGQFKRIAIGAGSVAAAKVIVAFEAEVLGWFAANPAMIEVIVKLMPHLKKLAQISF